jgi:hypothetical protein
MNIAFTEEEALKLLKKMPTYSRIIDQSNGIDILKKMGKVSPEEIISSILEGIPYED